MSDLEKLEKLASLLEKGLLTREEFEAQKKKLLGAPETEPESAPTSNPQYNEPIPTPETLHKGLPSALNPSSPKLQGSPTSSGQQPSQPHRSSARPQRETYWTTGRIVLAAIGIPAMLLLIFILVGGGALTVFLASDPPPAPAIVKQARFEITDLQVSDDCSRLTDYCIRVSCAVTNVGNGDGRANIEVQMVPLGKAATVHNLDVRVPVGETRQVSHDFTEAKLSDDHEGRCVVR